MASSLPQIFHEGDAPRTELANNIEFPVGTIATLSVNNDTYTVMKQANGSWTGTRLHSTDPADHMINDEEITIATDNDLPTQTMARIDIPSDSHSGSFSWLQYLKEDALKEDDRQWKLVDAVFIDEDRTYIKILPQAVYKPENGPPLLVVNYHATPLARILEDPTGAIHNPGAPAFTEVITNEKRSIRYRFSGWEPNGKQKETQVRIRTERKGLANSRAQLANNIAKNLKVHFEEAGPEALRFFGEPVEFDKLVLISAVFTPDGTIQPRLGVI
ncbi:hypothetical protein C8Q70DRAFT_609016 [Cubamyces menziesii]|uniref:Uncharacterized protein n=1 Tax=Trametes cubensis TaxID=1111947 RepID=A0AAD7TZP2_9APHY|nr:hypothetical protein C8Q70DRAFT_609016 [Cubamyces menziesii]KAJ8494351.1 hypothetical protein ONZ51_g2375 [Trametes cubensis]